MSVNIVKDGKLLPVAGTLASATGTAKWGKVVSGLLNSHTTETTALTMEEDGIFYVEKPDVSSPYMAVSINGIVFHSVVLPVRKGDIVWTSSPANILFCPFVVNIIADELINDDEFSDKTTWSSKKIEETLGTQVTYDYDATTQTLRISTK